MEPANKNRLLREQEIPRISRTLSWPLLSICCLGVLSGGCQSQWALSIQPGDVNGVSPGQVVAIEVRLEKGAAPRGANGATLTSAVSPESIRITAAEPGSGLEFSEPNVRRLDDDSYLCTFTCTPSKTFTYMIDANVVPSSLHGKGLGPYAIVVDWIGPYAEGHDRAMEFRRRGLPAYRLVVALCHLKLPEQQRDFLRGFRTVYAEANDVRAGDEFAGILRQSLACAMFEQAAEQGRKHASGQVADDQVMTLIRRTRDLSLGCALGWKAGYIEGFVSEMATRTHDGQDRLYQLAETKYNVLSPFTE